MQEYARWQAEQNSLDREQAIKEKWANNSASSDRKAPGIAGGPATTNNVGTSNPGEVPIPKNDGAFERTPGGVLIERTYQHRDRPGQSNAMQQTGWGSNEVVHTPFNQASVGIGPSLNTDRKIPTMPLDNTTQSTSTDTSTGTGAELLGTHTISTETPAVIPNPKDNWGMSAMQNDGNITMFDDDLSLKSEQQDFKARSAGGTTAAPTEGVDTTRK